MKVIVLKNNKKSIEKATRILTRSLKKGDIILSGPIPKNTWTRFFNIILMITRKVLRGITHACLYLGNNKVLDIDQKITEKGNDIFRISIKGFIKRKISQFGGVMIYVVQPKKYKNKYRKLVVAEAIKNFFKKSKNLKHSYFESLKVGLRFLFKNPRKYKENLVYRKHWTCGHFVAYIFKKSGVDIGRRASYMFLPTTFAFSKHFKVKRKIILK